MSRTRPSGPDGGRGGDVYWWLRPHQNTLPHFRFNPEHKAERGGLGEGSNRTGHEGQSIELQTRSGRLARDGRKAHDSLPPRALPAGQR